MTSFQNYAMRILLITLLSFGLPAAFAQSAGTGALTGTSANFSGQFSAAGVLLPSTGTATPIQGFNSNAFDIVASVFNTAGAQNQAQNQLFRLQVEPAAGTNNTANPSATLNLLFGSSGAPGETGLSVNANGTINFAAGQSFPSGASGLGTITGVSAGTGLTGGGTGGNVTLNNTGILGRFEGLRLVNPPPLPAKLGALRPPLSVPPLNDK